MTLSKEKMRKQSKHIHRLKKQHRSSKNVNAVAADFGFNLHSNLQQDSYIEECGMKQNTSQETPEDHQNHQIQYIEVNDDGILTSLHDLDEVENFQNDDDHNQDSNGLKLLKYHSES